MFKNLILAYGLVLMTPTLYANDSDCEQNSCEGQEYVYYCPYCSREHYIDTGEEIVIDKLPSWPSKHEDPFMDALSN